MQGAQISSAVVSGTHKFLVPASGCYLLLIRDQRTGRTETYKTFVGR
jgi:hypothetical protein